MFKGTFFFIIFVILTTVNVAVSAEWGVDEDDIKSLKKSIKYIEQKKFDYAVYEATKTKDNDIFDLVLWMSYVRGYEGHGYDEITAFVLKNSTWPSLKIIRNRAEFSLPDGLPPEKVVSYFKNDAPVTGHAMRILAEAKIKLGHDEREINELIRRAWRQGDFGYDEEKNFIKDHLKRLRQEDHLERIDRLLWEHKLSDAKKIIRYVSSEYKTLFTARIYLITRRRGVDALIARVDDKLQDNPGLLYDRIQWHMKRKNYNRVYQYIKQVDKTMPYQEKWWKIKNVIIRELIDELKYKEAYAIASNHGNEPGTSEFAESAWLSGWLAYIIDKKDEAYSHFYDMYKSVNYPVSKSRAAYWAGRVSEETKNNEVAEKWYKLAAEHTTTFYGQMAHLKVYPNQKLKIEADFGDAKVNHARYKNNRLTKIAYMLIKVGEHGKAKQFIKAAIDENNSAGEMHLISELGIALNQVELSVMAAKEAIKKQVVLTNTGWPVIATSSELYADKPLVMAIARQESLFDTNAKSGAGARGLMQLMPATAKFVAGEIRKSYSADSLNKSPEYNLQLGSYYINHLINRFDGSYVLAIASYNAGPSNVKKWIEKFGDPRNAKNHEQVINWIEHVPFKETRNYIQRVLENIQVYRHIFNDQSVNLERDLLRYNTKLSSN
ncbi:MAG: hypothetical protein COV35_06935 [Alphaproteobacteria bacterium CG11_big_fil_rev_8_21_14_0_20_39_49]|nr:MAG: hypothetical protein COV35_06935 [Alphaproteobacteria bacterium CG11_big_fil_rev_8_21_14_0_20_39_49]